LTWQVECFIERGRRGEDSVVEAEILELLADRHTADGVTQNYTWLIAVDDGCAVPENESSIMYADIEFRYRADRRCVVIYTLDYADNLVRVLRFAARSDNLPHTSDLAIAADRLQRWD
jgi:hypothetical protein